MVWDYNTTPYQSSAYCIPQPWNSMYSLVSAVIVVWDVWEKCTICKYRREFKVYDVINRLISIILPILTRWSAIGSEFCGLVPFEGYNTSETFSRGIGKSLCLSKNCTHWDSLLYFTHFFVTPLATTLLHQPGWIIQVLSCKYRRRASYIRINTQSQTRKVRYELLLCWSA